MFSILRFWFLSCPKGRGNLAIRLWQAPLQRCPLICAKILLWVSLPFRVFLPQEANAVKSCSFSLFHYLDINSLVLLVRFPVQLIVLYMPNHLVPRQSSWIVFDRIPKGVGIWRASCRWMCGCLFGEENDRHQSGLPAKDGTMQEFVSLCT